MNNVASLRRTNAFVWDYELVQSVSSFRWQNGTTYYVSGPFTVQTNIFESCVVKYAPGSNAKITITGPVTCLATNYSLIHLTHRDDHTIGETIGSAVITNYAASSALFLDYSGSIELSSLRVKYASTGIGINQGGVHTLRDVQILDCAKGIEGYNYNARLLNGLIARVTTAFGASPSSSANTALVQHVTVNQANTLSPAGSPSVNLFVTNSLLVAVTNVAAFSGANNGTNSTPSAVFQTAGAAAHYLANNLYRGNGSVNIDAALLNSLRRKTTWPPTLFPSNTTIGNTNLVIAPQIERDDGLPDLGWHYDPLDIVFGSAYFTNSTILITNGAAVGTYLVSSGTYGIGLSDNARLFSEGQPTNLNRIVRYNTVQEQANNNWTNRGPSIVSTPTAVVNAPQARFRFTGFSIPARDAEHFYGADGGVDLAVPFLHCQFEGGSFYSMRPQVYVTNCLFQRVAVVLESGETGFDAAFRHNTFNGGTNYLFQLMPGTWTVKDNLFDGTAIHTNATGITHDYNGYTTNLPRYLPVPVHDVTLITSNVAYETGPLGRFYLPANSALTNKASQSATNVGLYHFTCTTNQVKETNSTADIGFHYVALSSTNTVFDTDAEGLPDYVEDADGDGIVDTAESSWLSPGYTNGLSDLQVWELSSNVQVNDPAQDTGSNTNTQFETTMVAFGNTVIAAWVDSNLGVAGLGAPDEFCATNWTAPRPPQFIGWAVSRNRSVSFTDKGTVPMLTNIVGSTTNILGDAGDPVLGWNTNNGIVYLLGNPQRPSFYYPNGSNNPANIYVPLWRSTNNGDGFLPPLNVLLGVQAGSTHQISGDVADKPAMVVDNAPGVGQGDVFMAIRWDSNLVRRTIFNRAEQSGTNWQIMTPYTIGGVGAERPALAVRTNHEICLVWIETNNIMFAKSTNRGAAFSTPVLVVTPNKTFFSLQRSTNSPPFDEFNAAVIPSLTANPTNNDLYVVYHDQPTNLTAAPNVYLVQSTNAGVNWDPRIKVNVDTNINDHWQPTVTVKSDGTKVFIAWYDRRNDAASNSLIQIYGTFSSIPITGTNSFTNNFLISTAQFPPIFSGIINTNIGTYDPVYPPRFATNDARYCGSFDGRYRAHKGDYDTAVSDNAFVYYSWFDRRSTCTNSGVIRNQADIRSIRVSWPR